MKIALTGAGGQLGSFFSAHLKQSSDRFDAYKRHEWDIQSQQDSNKFLSYGDYDVLINCAAYTDVEKAEIEQQSCFDINAHPLDHLSKLCKKQGIMLVHFSTDYIFDGDSQTPYQETDQPNPLNAYGASKLEGEQIIQASGCRYLIGRLSWLFGGNDSGFTSKLQKWRDEHKVLTITSDEVSAPTFAGHVPRVILSAVEKNLEGIFHINNSGSCSRYEWARYFAEQNDWANTIIKPAPMSSFKTQARRPSFSVMCNKKIQAICRKPIPEWKLAVKESIQKNIQ